ncbi:Gmad2 immunoglobulin-like domain-containing protein [Patescibacteria group bacterium]|nr:Gmad2 immunoglobulin-like domain-containing protein [Patescibacteria group bacterium]
MEKNYVWAALVVLIILIGGYFLYSGNAQAPTVEEGAPSGGTFSYINASSDLIVVDSPKPGQTVGQVISVSGSARGYWFFEASFPIELLDNEGAVIGQGIAQAEGDWMTEEFVPFKARMELSNPYYGDLFVVLKKDNPSGEPENDASVRFPVVIQN